MSNKNLKEKYFDVRSRDRYLTDGVINKKDVESYMSALPDDKDNFDICVLEDEDDLGLDPLNADEISNMPPMTEEDIDNFDFLSLDNSENKS